MKKYYKSSNLERIVEDNYRNHPIYKAADCVCRTFQPQIKTITLYEYDMFYEAMKLIDAIKAEGEEFGKNHPKIARNYYDELEEKYPQSPVEERMQIANILLYFVASILYMHDSYFGRTAELLNLDSIQDDGKFEEYIMDISNSCDYLSEEICDWINSYMALDNDEYISNDIADAIKNGGKPKEEKQQKLTDATFKLINGTLPEHIELVYSVLSDKNNNWIVETTLDDFKKLFCGTDNKCKIYWNPEIGMDNLVALFKMMIDNGFIEPTIKYYLKILKSHFYITKDCNMDVKNRGSVKWENNNIIMTCKKHLEIRIGHSN